MPKKLTPEQRAKRALARQIKKMEYQRKMSPLWERSEEWWRQI